MAQQQAAQMANQFEVDFSKGSSKIEFLAVGRPSAIKIRGKSSTAQGILKVIPAGNQFKVEGTIKVPLEPLDTGIALRDRHMKEKYLEVKKYPNAELTLTEAKLPSSFNADDFKGTVPFSGTLDLHGQKRPVSGNADVEKHGSETTVHVEFPLKLSEFGIPTPEFSGIKVAEDVQVFADLSGNLVQGPK